MGKRVFDTYHATEAEIDGVKAAFEAAEISFYETFKGKFGLGSAALWVVEDSDYARARSVIDEFQAQWIEQVRQEPLSAGINWRRVPALLIVIAAVCYLTLFWYF